MKVKTYMQREKALEIIKSLQDGCFSDEEKRIAINIIKKCENWEVNSCFDFIMSRKDLGFVYDSTPENCIDNIFLVQEKKEWNINCSAEIRKEDFENKLIIGENYNALKNLVLTHKKAIDVIYIDPPYNTKKANEEGNSSRSNAFQYNDKWEEDGYLNMMNNRLFLAEELLKNGGLLFISIDDNERARLQNLIEDKLKELIFVKSIIWRGAPQGKAQAGQFAKTKQYVLVYVKKSKYIVNQDELFKWPEDYFNKESQSVATRKLNEFIAGEFSFPKSLKLLKTLIKCCNNKNAIVLDFFAGSGTTGHAVLELNKEDEGSRTFILVNNNENQIAYKYTYPRLYKAITGKNFKNKNSKLVKNKVATEKNILPSLRVFTFKMWEPKGKENNILDKETVINHLHRLNPFCNLSNIDPIHDLSGIDYKKKE